MKRSAAAAVPLALTVLAACAGPGTGKVDDTSPATGAPFAPDPAKWVRVVEKDGMIEIPQGWFVMGWDLGEINERPEHKVFLGTYWIDKYEVSARDFAAFLNEKGNDDDMYFSEDAYSTIVTERGRGKERDRRIFVPRKGYENYPANNVSWLGADAYCRWKGKRLPTEAEWEKAARGEDGRIFPWGNVPPGEGRARYGKDFKEEGFEVMAPVDSLPEGASYYGAYNMAGNVWEWVDDWYRQNYCDFCGDFEGRSEIEAALTGERGSVLDRIFSDNVEVPPRRNPKGPETGAFKVLRGGSWYDSEGEKMIRTTYRYWFSPEDMYLNTGFRCAR